VPYRTVTRDTVARADAWPRGSFLGNAFRAVTGVIGGAIGGFIAKGVPGAIGGAVGGAVQATKANIASDKREAMVATAPPLAPPPLPSVGLVGAPMVNTAVPGGSIITQSPLGTPVSQAAIDRQIAALGGGGTRGKHPNKSWTYSRRTGQLAAPGTKMVSNRTMNWANGKAMGRAERRIKSFVKHARRYVRWVSPAKKGKLAPRFGKK